jgi:hypothetical protein
MPEAAFLGARLGLQVLAQDIECTAVTGVR